MNANPSLYGEDGGPSCKWLACVVFLSVGLLFLAAL